MGLPITVLLLMGLVYNMPIKNTPLMANSVNNVSNSTISKRSRSKKKVPKDDGRDYKLFVIPLVPSQRMLKLKSNQLS